MSFMRNQCRQADRLDNRFTGIRDRITCLFLAGELTEQFELKLNQTRDLVLNRIMDHQVSCGCHLPR
jgi:hypothetical protein